MSSKVIESFNELINLKSSLEIYYDKKIIAFTIRQATDACPQLAGSGRTQPVAVRITSCSCERFTLCHCRAKVVPKQPLLERSGERNNNKKTMSGWHFYN